MTAGTSAGTWFARFFDDAAVFPPGNAALAEAIKAHRDHHRGRLAPMIGPLVIGTEHLHELGRLAPALDCPLAVAVVTRSPALVEPAISAIEAMPSVELEGLEVALPQGIDPELVIPDLVELAVTARVGIAVEIPRGDLHPDTIGVLAQHHVRAKIRTGGLVADADPSLCELTTSIFELVTAGVAFKATAGLHHAVRNTDPLTGFEQHGFLNVLAAVCAAMSGAPETAVALRLAERDQEQVLADLLSRRGEVAAARRLFTSFGTCSIVEPTRDLEILGLIDPSRVRP